MKEKIFLLIILILLFSSVNAFTLKTVADTKELENDIYYRETRDDYQKGELVASAGKGVFTLQPYHNKAVSKAIISSKPSITLNMDAGFGKGDYTFQLEGIEPTTYLRGKKDEVRENCHDRCFTGFYDTGPKAAIIVKKDARTICGKVREYKCVYGTGGHKDQITCQNLRYRITSMKAPEYKETYVDIGSPDGRNDTYYLLLGSSGVKSGMEKSTSREIKVDFCISLRLGNGWTECVETREALKAVMKGEKPPDTEKEEDEYEELLPDPPQSPGTPQEASKKIAQNTRKAERESDSKIQETRGMTVMGSEELEKCTSELNQEETKLIAKARFEYTRAIGYPPGTTGWNEFVSEEIENAPGARLGRYRFGLAEHYPQEVDLQGNTVKEPKFTIMGYDDQTDTIMNCCPTMAKAGYRKLNEVQNCDYHGEDGVIQFKVYKYEAPYFKETTAAEKKSTGKNEILRMGPHCFDVWAYLAVRFKKKDSKGNYTDQYSWWITEKEEAENFLNQTPNFKVIVQDVKGDRLENAQVTVVVKGGDFVEEKSTNQNGIAQFTVPTDKTLRLKVEKDTYNTMVKENITASDSPITIELEKALYTMRLIFSKDDFWWLYYHKILNSSIFLPEERQAKISELERSVYQIDEDEAKELYNKAPNFFWLQTQDCEGSSGEKIIPSVSSSYNDHIEDDYLGFKLQCYRILVFPGLEYGGIYYSCIDLDDKKIEIKWKIEQDGELTGVNRREI